MTTIDNEVNTDKAIEIKPPYQVTPYLNPRGSDSGNSIPIIKAWHQRLVEIKNPTETDLNDDDDSAFTRYKAFFRNAISSSDAAKLKRCQHMDDVAIQPAFIALWQQVTQTLPLDTMSNARKDNTFAAWLAIAWVLAQVRSHDSQYQVSSTGKNKSQLINSLGRVAGQHIIEDRPLITPLRFEKLISASDPNNFVSLLARMVGQLQQQKQAINIVVLANDILHWFNDYLGANHRSPRDKLTVQWSLAYYQSSSG